LWQHDQGQRRSPSSRRRLGQFRARITKSQQLMQSRCPTAPSSSHLTPPPGPPGAPNGLSIKVNGIAHRVDVDGDTPLLWVLRDVLGMTGTKFGCGMALCGACTVHVDGAATRSCITPIDSIGTSDITTIEAIGATAAGAKIQKAWLDREVVQCGYCQSG